MCTASAPISVQVQTTLQSGLSCKFSEMYGLTETSGVVNATAITDPESGYTGATTAAAKLKIRDIPEMGYLHTDKEPRGEVCIYGSPVTPGYFREPKKTADSIINGWLHTGDVGIVRPDGKIKIIDRIKHIFKLSNGEYVAPEKLENVFVASKYVMQNFVHGDPLKDYLTILVVPDPEMLKDFKGTKAELEIAIMKDLNRLADEKGLKSMERPRQIFIADEPFSDANGLLTPSQKAKRSAIGSHYKKQLAELYDKPQMIFKKPKL